MKLILIVSSLLTLVLLLGACGGGSESPSFVPKPIPSEYKGMSVVELKPMSKTPSHQELVSNIDNYKGKLVWLEGKVVQVFEGSEAKTYQIYVNVTHDTRGARNPMVTGKKVDRWTDPILLLYTLERGPELHKDDMVQVAGTINGILPKGRYTWGPGFGPTSYDRPMLSVIKAALVSKSSN